MIFCDANLPVSLTPFTEPQAAPRKSFHPQAIANLIAASRDRQTHHYTKHKAINKSMVHIAHAQTHDSRHRVDKPDRRQHTRNDAPFPTCKEGFQHRKTLSHKRPFYKIGLRPSTEGYALDDPPEV